MHVSALPKYCIPAVQRSAYGFEVVPTICGYSFLHLVLFIQLF